MTLAEVRSLFAYDRWANARVLEVLGGLSDEQLTEKVESSFPSVLATFAHVVAAGWIWLRRWQGESPTTPPAWVKEPDLAGLRTILADVEGERESLLDRLGEEDLDRDLEYRLLDGSAHATRLGDLFLHVVNHSSYHRGQLATLIRQVGGAPVATDYVLFRRETAAPP